MVVEASALQLRPLTADDAATFRALRLQALHAHPDVFGASAAEQAAMPLETLAQAITAEHQFVLGAWRHAQLVGSVALLRHTATKMVHIADLWGMYVAGTERGQGVADALLTTLLTHARTVPGLRQVRLSVTSHNHRAIALYARHGFVRWGTAPQQLCVGDQYFDEDHMVCML